MKWNEIHMYIQARIQDFLGGGGPKFEIMRAKYWYVMVTNSDVMRGGGSVQGGASFPLPPPWRRKFWRFIKLLQKEDDSLYRSQK